jgi:hypothetical protein
LKSIQKNQFGIRVIRTIFLKGLWELRALKILQDVKIEEPLKEESAALIAKKNREKSWKKMSDKKRRF